MNRILFFIFVLFFFYSCKRGEVTNYVEYLNHNDTVRYVGKEQCKMCHVDIYNSFIHTGMGRSLDYATRDNSVLNDSNLLVIYDSISNLSYEPFFRNDSLYIREFRLRGTDTSHLITRKVNYKIGSGQHTNSHLFEINGYLHQIPYTYYTQKDTADLPPGFELGNNSRFDRKIALECISCHNAYIEPVEGSINKYNTMPRGIDCERCHGPGEVHVKQKLAGDIIDTSKYIDYSIVNPKKLNIDLQFDVCQRCHLQGNAVLVEGKTFNDFKPGEHLKDVMDIYLPRYEDDDDFIMASHPDRLKQSACFQNSTLTCISCHNPHKSVTSLSSDYFDSKCMSCHMDCKDEQEKDCAQCHMPKSSSTDIMHVTITDHKIGIHKEKKKRGKFLGLFANNNNKPTNISKAKAYLKQYESFEAKPIYLDSALYFLDLSDNNFTSYVQYYYLSNNDKGLINYVRSTVVDTSKYMTNELALSYSRIAELFAENELIRDAEFYYKKSIRLMPFVIEYKIKYGSFLFNNNLINKAADVYIDVLSLNPMVKEAYLNLGIINMINNKYSDAEDNFHKSIALDPDYILAYENLVLLYDKRQDLKNTRLYLQKILDINPEHRAVLMLDDVVD